MNRQEEFKQKFFALLREYNVTMEVVEEFCGYNTYASGVEFFSYTEWDENGDVKHESIDFKVGRSVNGY
jgi:hypothetical protein